MSKSIKALYQEVRVKHQTWLEGYDEAFEKFEILRTKLSEKITGQEALDILKELGGTESEINNVKIRLQTAASRHNSWVLRDWMRFRDSNQWISFGPFTSAREINQGYSELLKVLLEAMVDAINANPSTENEHKALCLARDLVRFKKLMWNSELLDFSKIDVEESAYIDLDIFNFDFCNVLNGEMFDEYVFQQKHDEAATEWVYSARLKETKSFCERVLMFIDRLTDYNLIVIK